MNNLTKFVTLILCLIPTTSALTQSQATAQFKGDTLSKLLEEVIVVGTRFGIPIEQSGKTVYTINQATLEQNAGKSIADVLNEVPGIQIDGNFGTPGTNLGVFARGGRNQQTLILIDGSPLNDPSGIQPFYDLRLLSFHQVESIEVLKGGISTLYGTGASAAVINIKLKSFGDHPLVGLLDVSAGSFQTFKTNLSLNGTMQKWSYLISGNWNTSNGFSAAMAPNPTMDFEDDGYDQANGLLKLSYQFSDQFRLNSTLAYDQFETGYDDGPFLDADNEQSSRLRRFSLNPSFEYDKGLITMQVVLASNTRDFESSFPVKYSGRNYQVEINQKHQITNSIIGFWGLNVQHLAYQQDELESFAETEFNQFDPFISLFYNSDNGFNIHAGGRLNHHTTYGNKFIYNFNPSYRFNLSELWQLKVSASVAESYITPSGFQLFSFYGNSDLDPEESFNAELSLAGYHQDRIQWNIAYFFRDETNAIDFASSFDSEGNFISGQYVNDNRTRQVRGLEADISYQLSEAFTLKAYYSQVNRDDFNSFFRLPKNKFGATLFYQPSDRTAFNFKYNFTGRRNQFDFGSNQEIKLNSFGLIDLYAQHAFMNEKLRVYGAVLNMLNVDFIGIYGFNTRGRTYSLGFQFGF